MFVLKLSEGVLPLQTPRNTGLLMTSCWKSMRDSCSWLLRWPQTRNLSFHSSDREICSVALKRSPVDRELASCHVAGVLLPPISVPSVSQPEAAFFFYSPCSFSFTVAFCWVTLFHCLLSWFHIRSFCSCRKKSNQSFNRADEHDVIWYKSFLTGSLIWENEKYCVEYSINVTFGYVEELLL